MHNYSITFGICLIITGFILFFTSESKDHELPTEEPTVVQVVTEEVPLEPYVWVSEPSYEDQLRARANLAVQTLSDDLSRDFTTHGIEERADIIAAACLYAWRETGIEIDPFDLAIIWRYETGLSLFERGDYQDGVWRSCGATQIRTDFPGRPTCEELRNPYIALRWTAMKLVSHIEEYGHVNIRSYNGGGEKATLYGLRHNVTYALLERVSRGQIYNESLQRYSNRLVRNFD